jgi:hypothetical protein
MRPGGSCELSRSGAQLASGRAETRGRRRTFQFVWRAETGAPLSAFFSSRVFNSSRISRGFFPAARYLATSGGSLTADGGRSPHAEAANTAITSGQDPNRRLGMMPPRPLVIAKPQSVSIVIQVQSGISPHPEELSAVELPPPRRN